MHYIVLAGDARVNELRPRGYPFLIFSVTLYSVGGSCAKLPLCGYFRKY